MGLVGTLDLESSARGKMHKMPACKSVIYIQMYQYSTLVFKRVQNFRLYTINYHIKEIFKSEELEENSVIRKIRITAADGKGYETNCYNLDMAISVGYRVSSRRATFFRIWATKVLKEYMIKGFALDDERLSC